MAHLSRSDNDKMLSDMAENGSGGDYVDRYDDEEYSDFSGSGEKRKCNYELFKNVLNIYFKKIFYYIAIVPTFVEEPSTPVHIPKEINPNAASSLRISITTLFIVLIPSYVVILF